MSYFLYKLLPPRTTFMADMTAAERALMQEHATYWRGLMAQGFVIAFGPVADPNGPYGIAILRTEGADEARRLAADDPVIRATAGFGFDVHAMPSVVHP
ncbi:MAG TPA: YciI family protein [Vicinamibacterales bacterium]|jgi:uncharacterized protein YciI